jgi:hypothetical protein
LPLAGLLNVLPPQVHWSVEVPCLAIGAPERLAQAFTLTRAWLDQPSLAAAPDLL